MAWYPGSKEETQIVVIKLFIYRQYAKLVTSKRDKKHFWESESIVKSINCQGFQTIEA
jgi:paraquat-inducible protein B